MKVMIDRANSLYETDYQFRDVYLLSTAAENEDGVDHRALNGLNWKSNSIMKKFILVMVGLCLFINKPIYRKNIKRRRVKRCY